MPFLLAGRDFKGVATSFRYPASRNAGGSWLKMDNDSQTETSQLPRAPRERRMVNGLNAPCRPCTLSVQSTEGQLRQSASLLVSLAILALTSACSTGVASCIPGASVACACLGGLVGVQVCQANGTYAACSCPGTASSTGTAASSTAGTGTTAATSGAATTTSGGSETSTSGSTTAGTSTTSGSTTVGTSTTSGSTTTGSTSGSSSSGSTTGTTECDTEQCDLGDGGCGWLATFGPCGDPGENGNGDCCPGTTCRASDNTCQVPQLPACWVADAGIDAGCGSGQGQCLQAGTVCGWSEVGGGPCGLSVPGDLDCCPGLICGSSNFCVTDSDSGCM
jgi:hypothetical protein